MTPSITDKQGGGALEIDPFLREGLASVWHYHLSSGRKALCGAVTMSTAIRVESWGCKSGNVPASYCKKCDELRKAQPGEASEPEHDPNSNPTPPQEKE